MRNVRQKLWLLCTSPALWLVGGIGLAAISANLTAEDTASPKTGSTSTETATRESRKWIREGVRFESRKAKVRVNGEKVLFEIENEANPIEGLENLSLQRIYQAVLDDPNHDNWIVTGQITEYRDQNFLLIERGIRSADAPTASSLSK